jgi:hypothetical protein
MDEGAFPYLPLVLSMGLFGGMQPLAATTENTSTFTYPRPRAPRFPSARVAVLIAMPVPDTSPREEDEDAELPCLEIGMLEVEVRGCHVSVSSAHTTDYAEPCMREIVHLVRRPSYLFRRPLTARSPAHGLPMHAPFLRRHVRTSLPTTPLPACAVTMHQSPGRGRRPATHDDIAPHPRLPPAPPASSASIR